MSLNATSTGIHAKPIPEHVKSSQAARRTPVLNSYGRDSVHFGMQSTEQHDSLDGTTELQQEHPSGHHTAKEQQPTTGQRLMGAVKAAGKSLTSGKWWLGQLAIASAITLATCWLPGSQLITIPIWLAIASAYQAGSAAVEGYKDPFHVGKTKPPTTDRTGMKAELSDAEETDTEQEWSYPQKALGSVKGMGKQVAHDFVGHFVQNALVSGLITLATCWLPGSQLLTIPAWFCMDSAFSAVRGAYRGWKNPDYSPSKKEGKD